MSHPLLTKMLKDCGEQDFPQKRPDGNGLSDEFYNDAGQRIKRICIWCKNDRRFGTRSGMIKHLEERHVKPEHQQVTPVWAEVIAARRGGAGGAG